MSRIVGFGIGHDDDDDYDVEHDGDDDDEIEGDETEVNASGTVLYAELSPTAGQCIVFPAWLSHSVAPTHSGATQRISFAANWDFQVPSDDYPVGWRWF